MNFQKTYHALNVPISPSPALEERTLSRIRRRSLPLRRLAGAALAAALILATPALAVRTELGYHALYAVSPAAAQFFQPVRLRAEDQGVTMEVLSVRVEGSAAQAYISLSGGAVDKTCDLFDSWSFHLPFDQTGHCERVGYDEETQTALFLCETETMDGSPIPTGGKMTFSVGCFLSGKQSAEEQPVALELSHFAQEAETVPTGPDTPYYCTGGGFSSADYSRELLDRASLLKPGEVLAEPLEGLSITAAGYADGLFHVQLCRGNAVRSDNHGWFWLEDRDGNRLECLYSAGFCTQTDSGQRLDYDQHAFDIAPEVLADWTLHGSFFSTATLTEGHWQVTFPLKTTGGDLTAVENGHNAGSFDLQDTLLTFASSLEQETGRAIRWEDGFHYRLFSGASTALAEFDCPGGETLEVLLELVPYRETTGLWQPDGYAWSGAPSP